MDTKITTTINTLKQPLWKDLQPEILSNVFSFLVIYPQDKEEFFETSQNLLPIENLLMWLHVCQAWRNHLKSIYMPHYLSITLNQSSHSTATTTSSKNLELDLFSNIQVLQLNVIGGGCDDSCINQVTSSSPKRNKTAVITPTATIMKANSTSPCCNNTTSTIISYLTSTLGNTKKLVLTLSNLEEWNDLEKLIDFFKDLASSSYPNGIELRIKSCPAIRKLNTKFCTNITRITAESCIRLSSVNIASSSVSSLALSHLPNLSDSGLSINNSELKVLDISYCGRLCDVRIASRSVKSVRVSHCKEICNESFEYLVSNMPALESLVIANAPRLTTLCDFTIKSLSLQTLKLSSCANLSWNAVAYAVENVYTSLSTLVLENAPNCNSIFEEPFAVTSNPRLVSGSLKTLELDSVQGITDGCVSTLGRSCPALIDLKLLHLPQLEAPIISEKSELKRLGICSCSNLTRGFLQSIQDNTLEQIDIKCCAHLAAVPKLKKKGSLKITV